MRIVTLHEKLAGSVLAVPIHGDGGRLLLARGIRLTRGIIQNLMERGYTRIAIEDPLLDDVDPDEPLQEETRQKTVSILHNAVNHIIAGSSKSLRCLREAVEAIIEEITANKGMRVGIYSLCSYDDGTYNHSVNVCVLAICVADGLGISPQDLRVIGTGALLHDIGKLLVPKSILNKPGQLTPDEYNLIKTHTEKGWELLSRCFEIGALAALAALEHHERIDASGYPRRVGGDEISRIGRITAVADVYEAMSSDRPQRKALLPDAIYAFLQGSKGTLFDPAAVDSLLARVSLYPTGTIVALSDKRVGVVIRQDPRSNLRPVIRLVRGPDVGTPVDLPLYDNPQLKIEAILDDYPSRENN